MAIVLAILIIIMATAAGKIGEIDGKEAFRESITPEYIECVADLLEKDISINLATQECMEEE